MAAGRVRRRGPPSRPRCPSAPQASAVTEPARRPAPEPAPIAPRHRRGPGGAAGRGARSLTTRSRAASPPPAPPDQRRVRVVALSAAIIAGGAAVAVLSTLVSPSRPTRVDAATDEHGRRPRRPRRAAGARAADRGHALRPRPAHAHRPPGVAVAPGPPGRRRGPVAHRRPEGDRLAGPRPRHRAVGNQPDGGGLRPGPGRQSARSQGPGRRPRLAAPRRQERVGAPPARCSATTPARRS